MVPVDFADKVSAVTTYTMWVLVVTDEVRHISVDK